MLKIGSSFIAWMNGFHIAAQRLEQRSRARQGELHPHRAGRNSETAAITITTVAFSVYAIRPIVCKIAAVCIIHGPASEDAVALADRAQIRPIAYECQNLVVLGQHLCLIDVCETNEGNFYLLELNSFSSAGLYACKKELIVKRVSEIALEDYNKNK